MAEQSGISSQRRKLIRASAAAIPAIMTLRSGGAAATSSFFHRCLDQAVPATNLDPVKGDADNSLPQNDAVVYVEGRQGKQVNAVHKNSGQPLTYYGLRKNGTSLGWDDYLAWDWYDAANGDLKNQTSLQNTLANYPAVFDQAMDFYCVYTSPNRGWVCTAKDGSPITPSIKGDNGTFWASLLQTHTTNVYLIAYYNPLTGEITYYPMPQDYEAVTFTASCLTSVDPAIQL
jgi:hypothetical protein